MEGHFVEIQGLNIHYHDIGEGEPTLLIHGGGPGAGGYSNYSKNIGPLSGGRRVIVPDLPGYGRSDNQPPTATLPKMMADIVAGLMDKLGIERASFVGNSLGGATTLQFALDRPERARRLVLMGSAGGFSLFSPPPTEGFLRMWAFYDGEGPTLKKLRRVTDMLVFDPASVTDDLLEERLQVASRPDVIANPPLRMSVKPEPGRDIWQRLPELRHETLIIWGREDRVLNLDTAFPLLRLIKNAQLHVFPRCGHWAQWEKAEEFNALVTAFLDRE